MKTPKSRNENSDKPRSRGRQPLQTENSVGRRILEALGGESRKSLAMRTELPESTIGDAIARGPAKTDVAVKLASALHVSLDWLLAGSSDRALPLLDGGVADLDLVEVQEIDLAYGLGGTFSDNPVEVQTHHFPREWVESITATPPSLLTIARGRGDSMQPTIQDSDMVIIDRSQRYVREQDAIWALTVGEIAMIKRVRVFGDRVELLSDNERVPPYSAVQEEINIVGRLIFIGRRV